MSPSVEGPLRVRWVWAFVDVPPQAGQASVDFWVAVTGCRLSPWRGSQGEFATFLPEEGDAWLKLQRVGQGGGVHVDLDVDGPLEEARSQAEGCGATVLHETAGEDGLLAVVVCRSPGGFVFCLTRWSRGQTLGNQVRHGRDSLVDQVCLDIPADRYAEEVAFWSALTGWAVQDQTSAEFQRLEWPRHLPVRFLLQRLEEPSGTVRAHLDLACRDLRTEVDRHVRLGATELRPGDGWIVLRDPAGMEYCCTGRDPLSGDRSTT
ncbi:VOC family protein [Pedococcus sp. 5OH_020]|uniref:VOC family protein n=1 Tax=Pedococcus sp. 5OH_020 TaxID=2989814 RepID=UPI0022EA0606|nr:VOC family protein [Pedococcus sp. 5OH_020]